MSVHNYITPFFAALCLFFMSSLEPVKADEIDIGIFLSSEPNTIDIKIRPDFLIPTDLVSISEIRYTVRWPESDIELENILVFPFLLSPVGTPELHNGYYYLVFTNPTITSPYSEDINPMEEVVVASFEYSGDEMDFFEIVIDDWTQDNNGDFFVEFRGTNHTGVIYQPIVSGTERLIDIKVFLEGAYSSSLGHMRTVLRDESILPHSQPYNTEPWMHEGTEQVLLFHTDVVDWVLLEFIDAESAEAAAVANGFLTKALLLKKNGVVVNKNNSTPRLPMGYTIENNLFVIVRHRNHIDIMSQNPLFYDSETKTYSYDFSTALDKAYGGSAGYKLIDSNQGVFGMVVGDADADGRVFPSDRIILREGFGNTDVYHPADFDFDGRVFPSDRVLLRNNFGISNPL